MVFELGTNLGGTGSGSSSGYLPKSRTTTRATSLGPFRKSQTVVETPEKPLDQQVVEKRALAQAGDLPDKIGQEAQNQFVNLKELKRKMFEMSKELKTEDYPTGFITPGRKMFRDMNITQYLAGSKGPKMAAWMANLGQTYQLNYRKPVTGAQAGQMEITELKFDFPQPTDEKETFYRKARVTAQNAMESYNAWLTTAKNLGFKTGGQVAYDVPKELDKFDKDFLRNTRGVGTSKLLGLINKQKQSATAIDSLLK